MIERAKLGEGSGPGRPISLYVHVPYCCSKCRYCAFYSVTGGDAEFDAYLLGLEREWARMREEEPLLGDSGTRIDTIYLGGGTPSILGGRRLARLLEVLRDGPPWQADIEISLEANPESLTPETAAAAHAAGYNRLSLGVQSFLDRDLEALGRAARADEARRAIDAARQSGFDNLNLDLIYGLPSQSVAEWADNVGEALACRTEHLSCYLLTPEENTVLHRLLYGGELPTPLEEVQLLQYQALMGLAGGAGLEHYEISNFARAGRRCRHNVGTWRRQPYLGLGPAAHSFDGEARWQNAADVGLYLRSTIQEGQRPTRERYRLGAADVARELIILGLRLSDGVDWEEFEPVTSVEQRQRLRRRARFLVSSGFLRDDPRGLRLAPEAYFVSNAVFLELLRVLEDDEA